MFWGKNEITEIMSERFPEFWNADDYRSILETYAIISKNKQSAKNIKT